LLGKSGNCCEVIRLCSLSFDKALCGGKSEHLFSAILRGAKNSSG